MALIAGLAVSIGLSACDTELLSDREFACSSNADCLDGYVCVGPAGERTCVAEGEADLSSDSGADTRIVDSSSTDTTTGDTGGTDTADTRVADADDTNDIAEDTGDTGRDTTDAKDVSDSNDAADTADTADGTDTADTTDTSDGADMPDMVQPMRIDVTADIFVDTTWEAPNTYVLTRPIFVANNATLTIEAGVTVVGAGVVPIPMDQSQKNAGALTITRGAKLRALGTASDPIVFTSDQPVGSRAPGDWGGIVLLGNAPVNEPGGVLDIGYIDAGDLGIPTDWDDGGGTDESYSCGELRYVRIEFAGYQLDDDGSEFDALHMTGCGTGTVVDHVQVHAPVDDSIALTGGSVPLRHVVTSETIDEGIFIEHGYTGSIQFALVHSTTGGDDMIHVETFYLESRMRRSDPEIYNASIVGPSGRGLELVNGGIATARNVLIAGVSTGLNIYGVRTVYYMTQGDVVGEHLMVWDTNTASAGFPEDCDISDAYRSCTSMCAMGDMACVNTCRDQTVTMFPTRFSSWGQTTITRFFDAIDVEPWPAHCPDIRAFDEDAWFATAAYNNVEGLDPRLPDPTSPTGVVPDASSPTGALGTTPPAADKHGISFDTSATWIGAFDAGATSTWMDGWTAFPAN